MPMLKRKQNHNEIIKISRAAIEMMRAIPFFTFPTIKSVVNVVTNISATKYTNTKIGNTKIIIPSPPDNSSKSRKGKKYVYCDLTRKHYYMYFSHY